MKELQELRNEILTLRNYGVINKEEEKSLLNKLNSVKEQLTIPDVVGQSKQLKAFFQEIEKVCELIRQKFDDWVFGLETQSGEKLKVVDSTDFNDIITEIESELKDL